LREGARDDAIALCRQAIAGHKNRVVEERRGFVTVQINRSKRRIELPAAVVKEVR
jgi:hypothetical protein